MVATGFILLDQGILPRAIPWQVQPNGTHFAITKICGLSAGLGLNLSRDGSGLVQVLGVDPGRLKNINQQATVQRMLCKYINELKSRRMVKLVAALTRQRSRDMVSLQF